jgi:hypothetical protein
MNAGHSGLTAMPAIWSAGVLGASSGVVGLLAAVGAFPPCDAAGAGWGVAFLTGSRRFGRRSQRPKLDAVGYLQFLVCRPIIPNRDGTR